MGRSVKKGPYVEESLLVKIRALNERNEGARRHPPKMIAI